MFESAELGHAIDKATYKKEVPALREALLDAQYDLLKKADFSVIILISGVDGAGKGETVNILNEWMDPRHIETHALDVPSCEEEERPPMWRYWRVLPPKGKIGIFFRSWYSAPISDALHRKTKNSELDQQMDRIIRFEKMLADEGTLILKFWLHLSKESQRKRLKDLEKDPATRWRITERDWKNFKIYDRFRMVSEHVLRQTSTPDAPWTIIEGADPRYRYVAAGKAILQALRSRLDAPSPCPATVAMPPVISQLDTMSVLNQLDLSLKIGKKKYQQELEKYQGKLNLLTREAAFRRISVAAVFEGFDAAGKGSAIRRITGALDARFYRVIPTAAPTEEERAQPYLWRFWRYLPRLGHFAIFDRSWYGRVLVERVEEFCAPADWMRAYGEINDFEEQLIRSRTIVVKFWLHVSQEEQLRRFREREQTSFKNFKITPDDWRNREKRDEYERAVCDMIDRTSTEIAPWTLVEADDKQYARIKVLKTLCERIEKEL
jgi:polyphosphate:AMP phosphotransferase